MRRHTSLLVLVGNASGYTEDELALFDETLDAVPPARLERPFEDARRRPDSVAPA